MELADESPVAALVVVRGGGDDAVLAVRRAADECTLGLVDDLARLRLHLARLGWQVEVVPVLPVVAKLLDLAGLTGA